MELIKNSYDADADWVKVTFQGFGEKYETGPESKIIIEDNGHGMSQEVIEKHWLNPATPEKKNRKNRKKDRTEKGRTIQGEKGIGRFAMLKLGRKIDVFTKNKESQREFCVSYDFSQYNEDFIGKDNEALFIDQLDVSLVSRTPKRIIPEKVEFGTRNKQRSNHGTVIEISGIKGGWTDKKVESACEDISKLEPIFSFSEEKKKDFEVVMYHDNEVIKHQEGQIERMKNLLEDFSVLKITDGRFDESEQAYYFSVNGKKEVISLDSPKIKALRVFRDRFGAAGEQLKQRKIECGSFEFSFYIFDFSAQAPMRYKLDRKDKAIIKDHRIYLYRDGIRVYPYGESDDDWLRIDMHRGTISAGDFLSNDQVVGVVDISQKDNPLLKDKTNREGLIDEGYATEDFIALIQTFLSYIRQKHYARYRADIQSKKDQDIYAGNLVQAELEKLEAIVEGDKAALKAISTTKKLYNSEKGYLVRRAEMTEDLAGVGLSVETASHDIMAVMGRVLSNLDGLIQDLMSADNVDKEALLKEFGFIRGGLGFVKDQLKDIQLLFRSSKQRRKSIKVKDMAKKIEQIYRRLLKKHSIECAIKSVGSPLVAKTTDAVILQLLLNLFDNAVYWLQQVSKSGKKIEILLDGDGGRMIFSDNGPGIDKDDAPYIFEPFYSGKGEEGRGLGLYIARQLLERNDYSINLSETTSERILSGANFVVNFFAEEK